MKKIIYLFLSCAVLFACKKEKVVMDEGIDLSKEPVFTLEGTVDGQDVLIEAGMDDAFYETAIEQFHGVDLFKGRLISGSTSSEFTVHDGNIGLNIEPTSELINNVDYQHYDGTFLYLTKESFVNSSYIESINFSLDGENQGDTLIVFEPGFHSICVDITFSENPSNTHSLCNEVILGYVDHAAFRIQQISNGGGCEAWIQSQEEISSVEWLLDGQSFASTEEVWITSQDAAKLTAIVHFDNGLSRTRTVIVDPSNSAMFVNDITSLQEVLPLNAMSDYKVNYSISLNNTSYTLDPNCQTDINLLQYEYYGKNQEGKDIYKLKVAISGELTNLSTNAQVPVNLTGTVGIQIE